MKALKIILFSLSVLVLGALIAGTVLVSAIKKSGKPQYEGAISLKELQAPVNIFRDQRGMPHIYAENEHDLYFAVGFVMAQDRLWQMDLIRRATSGRLSEIFGKDYVSTDLYLRSLGITAKSKMVLASEDSTVKKILQYFADGINTGLKNFGKKLPPEFRILGYTPDPWKIEEVANIIGYMGWDLANGNLLADIFSYRLGKKLGFDKVKDLLPDWQADTTRVFPDFKLSDRKLKEALELISSLDKLKSLGIPGFSGSNNWAVAGNRSETGKPILSNDMHLALSAPGIWMQMHQVLPGKLNVTGVAIPGEPFIVAGHNEKIAWGMTNLMVDDIDLFMEKINPENENQYYFNGEWKNMEVRKEIIGIKGGKKDTIDIKYTHRGAIISGFSQVGIKDTSLSMRWSGYDFSDEIRAVYLIDRASSWEEFRAGLNHFRSISQNFIYADVNGNIGLNTGGGIPIRKGEGFLIRNGETDEYDWKGYVPFDQLPAELNPLKGSVSSANDKTVSDSYPYYISYTFGLPYRINRIREMLAEKEILGIGDFKRMVTDQRSDYARILIPFILRLKEKINELNPLEAESLGILENWNYDMNKDEAAPAIFEFFTKSLAKNLLSDELGELYKDLPAPVSDYYIFHILELGPDQWVDDINTSNPETFEEIVFRSFRDEIKALSAQYGPDPDKWKWGGIHTISLKHPLGVKKILDRVFKLNSPQYPIGGSNHTVCPYSYTRDFRVNHGASERHIFNTANWDESYTVIPDGNSGVPSSEFYLSQTKTYLEGGFYKDAFSDEAVKASAKYILKLVPGN